MGIPPSQDISSLSRQNSQQLLQQLQAQNPNLNSGTDSRLRSLRAQLQSNVFRAPSALEDPSAVLGTQNAAVSSAQVQTTPSPLNLTAAEQLAQTQANLQSGQGMFEAPRTTIRLNPDGTTTQTNDPLATQGTSTGTFLNPNPTRTDFIRNELPPTTTRPPSTSNNGYAFGGPDIDPVTGERVWNTDYGAIDMNSPEGQAEIARHKEWWDTVGRHRGSTTPMEGGGLQANPLDPGPIPKVGGADTTLIDTRGGPEFNAEQSLKEIADLLLKLGNDRTEDADKLRDALMNQANSILGAFNTGLERQQGFVNQFLEQGGLFGGLQDQLNLLGQSQGLSPAALSALRSSDEAQRAFTSNVEQLNTRGLQTGAMGQQDVPSGSPADAQGFRQLQEVRDRQVAENRRAAILADEQRKFESLLANQQTAGQALGTGFQGLGQVAQATNPTALLQAAMQGNQNALTALAAGNQPFNTQAGVFNSLTDTDPNSFKNSFLNALWGGAINTGFDIADHFLFGGKGGGGLLDTAAQTGLNAAKGALFGTAGVAGTTALISSAGVINTAALASNLAAVGPQIGLNASQIAGLTSAMTASEAATVGLSGGAATGGGMTAFLTSASFLAPAAIVVGGLILANKFIGQGRKAADKWVDNIQDPLYKGTGSASNPNGILARLDDPIKFGEAVPTTPAGIVGHLKKYDAIAATWNAGIEEYKNVASMDRVTNQAVNDPDSFGDTFRKSWQNWADQAGPEAANLRMPVLRTA